MGVCEWLCEWCEFGFFANGLRIANGSRAEEKNGEKVASEPTMTSGAPAVALRSAFDLPTEPYQSASHRILRRR